MNKEETLKYIKQAIELESSVVEQTKISNVYIRFSKARMPVLKLAEEKQRPMMTQSDRKILGWRIFGGIVCLAMTMPVVLAALTGDMSLDITTWLAELVFILLGIGLLVAATGIKRRFHAAEQLWMKEHEMTQTGNQARKDAYQENMEQWKASDEEARAYLAKPLKETQEALQQIYSVDVIYPKYHNLPALTSIYEYLLTGRCEELTGAHGAYNLYEDEVRKDKVISQLNSVIENLEDIKQQQYMLYEQVKGIQQNTRRIAAELQTIAGYTYYMAALTELNTYYAGVAARNAQALAYRRLL